MKTKQLFQNKAILGLQNVSRTCISGKCWELRTSAVETSLRVWAMGQQTLSEGLTVLWEDKRGRGGRHVRETCFNTPGRQNSPESGWKMQGGETGQKCVPLYKVFLSSSEKGPLLLCSAGSIWKEPDVCNCTPVNISQALSDDDQ